jgi:hypothetical protein
MSDIVDRIFVACRDAHLRTERQEDYEKNTKQAISECLKPVVDAIEWAVECAYECGENEGQGDAHGLSSTEEEKKTEREEIKQKAISLLKEDGDAGK